MKPLFLKGSPLKVCKLFDEIEQILVDHGPHCALPKSIYLAREQAVEWLVGLDIAMSYERKRPRAETELLAEIRSE